VRSFFFYYQSPPHSWHTINSFWTYDEYFFALQKIVTPFDRQSFFDVFEKPSHPHILVLLSLLFFETTPWPTMSLFYTFSTRTISRWWSVRYVDISICEIPGNKKDQHARRHIHIRVHTNSEKFCTRQFFFFLFQVSTVGMAHQLKCVSAMQNINIRPSSKIYKWHLAPENAETPRWWRLLMANGKKTRLQGYGT